MRTLPTILLGFLFAVCFTAFLLADSLTRYAADGEAFVQSAHDSNLRGSLVDATTELVVTELETDERLTGIDRTFVRAAVHNVLSEAWFEETLRQVHGAILRAASGTSESAVLDFTELKEALQDRLSALEGRAIDACRTLFGPDRCGGNARARKLLDAYQQQARAAISALPQRLELAPNVGSLGDDELGFLEAARWAAVALLVLALAGVIFLNAAPTRRLFRATGMTLAAAGALFLAIALSARLTASGAIADQLFAKVDLQKAGPGEPARLVVTGLRRFGSEIISDATHSAVVAAALVAGAGLVLFLLGALAGRDSGEA